MLLTLVISKRCPTYSTLLDGERSLRASLTFREIPMGQPAIHAADKQVHLALTKSKIGPLVDRFEIHFAKEIARHAEMVGVNGREMPLQTMGYRLIYRCVSPAVFGSRFPVERTRIQNQIFAENVACRSLALRWSPLTIRSEPHRHAPCIPLLDLEQDNSWCSTRRGGQRRRQGCFGEVGNCWRGGGRIGQLQECCGGAEKG